jgi:hypothetical protein
MERHPGFALFSNYFSFFYQAQDVLGMVKDFNVFKLIFLIEDFQANWAGKHQRFAIRAQDEGFIVFHKLAGLYFLTGHPERPSAANSSITVDKPVINACRLKDPFHRYFDRRGKVRHASGKVSHFCFMFTLRLKVFKSSAQIPGIFDTLGNAQSIDIYPDGTVRLASSAKQAVEGRSDLRLIVAECPEEISGRYAIIR